MTKDEISIIEAETRQIAFAARETHDITQRKSRGEHYQKCLWAANDAVADFNAQWGVL